MNKIAVVDLFAGPGGLGEGFSAFKDKNNNPVFSIALSIEKQTDAHKTLLLRSFFRKFPEGEAPSEYYDYLKGKLSSREILFKLYPDEAEKAKEEAWCAELGSGETINDSIDRRILEIKKKGGDRWVLIGGPPCQAYSVIGRSRNKGIQDYAPEKDPKSFLYREYLRIISKHLPAAFIMENVTGMLSARLNGESVFDKILSDLKSPLKTIYPGECQKIHPDNDYNIFPLIQPLDDSVIPPDYSNPKDYIIKSEKFGIPQRRHRVVLFGVRKKYSSIRPGNLKERNKMFSVMDVIQDLPKLRSGLSRNPDSMETWRKHVLQIGTDKWFKEYSREISAVQKCMVEVLADIENQNELETGGQFVIGNNSSRPVNDWWYRAGQTHLEFTPPELYLNIHYPSPLLVVLSSCFLYQPMLS